MSDWAMAIKTNIEDIGRMVRVVEVCGTHTATIHRYGLPSLFAGEIEFISGPGCPVCVTDEQYIDELADLSRQYTVYSFGDMMRVPGRRSSLAQARAAGGDVRIMLSPLDAVSQALQSDKPAVIAAIGFETTAPAFALAAEACLQNKRNHIRFLTELKTMGPPLRYLMQCGPHFDGLLLPGHVAVVIGVRGFRFVAGYGIPSVITGFEAADILQGLYMLTAAIKQQNAGVQNQYTRVVREEGNQLAQLMMAKYFKPSDAYFRGIGCLAEAGLSFREEYSFLECSRSFRAANDRPDEGCRCGEVLLGRIKPVECPLFRVACRPDQPRGACMVSAEGSCAAYFRFGGTYDENNQGAR